METVSSGHSNAATHYELIAVMTTYIRPVQIQVRPNPRMERVCGPETSAPS